MRRIAIVGAGLSGRLLAFNLLRHATSPVEVLLIDRGDARYLGPAYSDDADHLLLNVPAGRMGAVPGNDAHFLEWARRQGLAVDQWDFLPRRLYREYILALVRDAERSRAPGVTLEHVRAEVTDLEPAAGQVSVQTAGGESHRADKAVLALGNFLPRHPPARNRAIFASARYVHNPWNTAALDALTPGDPVVLIGTGQTTVDLVLTLARRGHRAPVTAISRRGYLPLAHRGFTPYPSFYPELRASRRIRELLRIVRRHIARAESFGLDARAVIDSLRPDTQRLWLNLPDDEKRRFTRHLVRYWEITRSRLPPQSGAAIEALRASGQLRIIAGRIQDMVDTGAAVEVQYRAPRSRSDEAVRAALVVNCMGPSANYARIDHPLVHGLRNRGLIRPGPASIGIDARPDGAVIGRDGAASGALYTLGPMMKGVLWESVAVPDIRVQAERLALLLLGGNNNR